MELKRASNLLLDTLVHYPMSSLKVTGRKNAFQ